MFEKKIIFLFLFFLIFSACTQIQENTLNKNEIIVEKELTPSINFSKNVSKHIILNESENNENKIEFIEVESNQSIIKEVEDEIVIAKFTPEMRWQWQLSDELNLEYEVDVYDIDLFETTQEEIDYLHSRGILVICYISAGSSENWREDFNKFESKVIGKKLDNWPAERWLDIRDKGVREVMLERMDLAVKKKMLCN